MDEVLTRVMKFIWGKVQLYRRQEMNFITRVNTSSISKPNLAAANGTLTLKIMLVP
jgi:hypothetical protein